MAFYSKAARRWVEPLLALSVGGAVVLRFLSASADEAVELGIVPPGEGTFRDYPAASSYVRELTAEEIQTLAGQFRQGAREVLLADSFARNVAAAEGHETIEQMFAAAAGLVISGEICRIRSFRPLEAGDEIYAWHLLCDAPLEAA